MSLKPLSKQAAQGIVFLTMLMLAISPVQAEGFFKQRIKERIKQKLEETPPPEATASVKDKLTQPGDYYFSIQHDGLPRMYRVHVPEGYNGASPAPLLIAFHGGGGDMDYMAKDEHYGLIAKSDKEGFVLVFPSGYSKFKSGKIATWNAGKCCGDARDKKIDDVGFVRQIISNLSAQMKIDRNKIYATGMSNGGMMSHRLACEMADTFKAVAPVAGTDGTLSCNPSQPISVLNIHAINDTHVLFNGGAGKDVFKDASMVTEFVSVPETVARWVKRDQCTGSPQRVLSVEGAYCDQYSSCAGGVKVQVCVTESGGHSWPGGNKPGGIKRDKEDTSKAISANDVMWDFFESLN